MNHASYCKRVEWMLPLIWWIKIYINIYMSQTTLNGRLPLNWMRRVAVSTEPNSCQSVPVLSLSVDKQTDGPHCESAWPTTDSSRIQQTSIFKRGITWLASQDAVTSPNCSCDQPSVGESHVDHRLLRVWRTWCFLTGVGFDDVLLIISRPPAVQAVGSIFGRDTMRVDLPICRFVVLYSVPDMSPIYFR